MRRIEVPYRLESPVSLETARVRISPPACDIMKINVEKWSVKEWLAALDGASRGSHYSSLWKRVYALAAVPSRRRTNINLYKIDRHSKEGDNVVVPGKVLSTGPITHSFKISAIEFSAEALRALKDANCKVVDIREMVKADRVHVIV